MGWSTPGAPEIGPFSKATVRSRTMPRSESPKRANVGAGARLLAIALPLSLSLTACGAGAAKELALVRTELDLVHKEHAALANRVGELEGREHDSKATPVVSPAMDEPAPGSTAVAPVDADSKSLKVVKLEPKPIAAAPEPTPEEDEPRPFLKIGPSGSIEQSLPDEPKSGKKSIASKTPVFEAQAAKDYDAAYALVKAKKPQQAVDAFGGFIVRYPDHPYAANALYWRGECYYQLGDYTGAVNQFDTLTIRYPGSNKLAEGLLKLGLSHRKLGSTAKARAAFERLKKDFPTSQAAKKIPPEDAS